MEDVPDAKWWQAVGVRYVRAVDWTNQHFTTGHVHMSRNSIQEAHAPRTRMHYAMAGGKGCAAASSSPVGVRMTAEGSGRQR